MRAQVEEAHPFQDQVPLQGEDRLSVIFQKVILYFPSSFYMYSLFFDFLTEVHSASYQKSESDQDYSSNREDEEDVLLESDSIRRRKRELHPFLKLLLAFWPFGETFQALRIWGKVYELIKVL